MNVKLNEKARTLTITIPLKKAGKKSGSGKNFLLASTGGSREVEVNGFPANAEVKVGLNVFSDEDVIASLDSAE